MDFSAQGPYRFRNTARIASYGVYLLTVKLDSGHLTYYVGKGLIPQRLADHRHFFVSGQYAVCRSNSFHKGIREVIYEADPTNFTTRRQELSPEIDGMLEALTVLVIPISALRLRKSWSFVERLTERLEAALFAILDSPFCVNDPRGVHPRRNNEPAIPARVTTPNGVKVLKLLDEFSI